MPAEAHDVTAEQEKMTLINIDVCTTLFQNSSCVCWLNLVGKKQTAYWNGNKWQIHCSFLLQNAIWIVNFALGYLIENVKNLSRKFRAIAYFVIKKNHSIYVLYVIHFSLFRRNFTEAYSFKINTNEMETIPLKHFVVDSTNPLPFER